MKLPNSYKNWISFLGTIIATLSFLLILLLLLLSRISNFGGSYLGLLIYLIIPAFLIFGLLLIPVGMLLKRRRLKKAGTEQSVKWLKIDLNETPVRNAAFIFLFATIIFLIFTIFGTYQGYHYSESVEFCGKLCHNVMEPEYTAYQNSPHAKVKCVECHVGEGADWMVKSKLNGTRQVFKTMLGSFPKPIPTPITNLRPARETCEKCHWPQKFYPDKIHSLKYYLADSLNTAWNLILKMKVGAEHAALGHTKGIHWHINPDIKVEYIHFDEKREDIFWVKLTNLSTGKTTIYKDEQNPIPEDSLKRMTPRTMDCIDCHNRPSHDYKSPPYYVNTLFSSGKLKTSVPFLKQSAMKALNNMNTPRDSAFKSIRNQITQFYKEKHLEVWQKYKNEIENAIPEFINAYSLNTFPEMKVSYLEYSKHIGHLESKGCFRCHDDFHKSDDGRVISKDCNLCHTIVGQGKEMTMKYSSIKDSLEFEHPIDIEDAWKEYNCSECHNVLFP
jgi:nitrate/TMAO reductase-like tetraheme cytochrome c subunit